MLNGNFQFNINTKVAVSIILVLICVITGTYLWSCSRSVPPAKSTFCDIPRAPLIVEKMVFWMPKEQDVYFRKYSYVNSMYLHFRTNGTYREIDREHMGVEERDRGTWSQDESGTITLASNDPTKNRVHITPMIYKGIIFLLWKDDKLEVRDLNEVREMVDELEPGKMPAYIFTRIDAETFRKESASTQEFIFYPELNKCIPQPEINDQ